MLEAEKEAKMYEREEAEKNRIFELEKTLLPVKVGSWSLSRRLL